jgi:hypothetical protein
MGEWFLALAPVIGLAVNALLQAGTAHLLQVGFVRSVLVGVGCGLTATAILVATADNGAAAAGSVGFVDSWGLALATYLGLSFGSWAFSNLNVTSLRIRMLRELLRVGGTASAADLLQRYTPAEQLRRRLDRLTVSGDLQFDGSRWRLTPRRRLLLIARCIGVLRALIIPRASLRNAERS